jgi:hypothetical protein
MLPTWMPQVSNIWSDSAKHYKKIIELIPKESVSHFMGMAEKS